MNYNLDDAPETFEFVLGGKSYLMRYPTTEEMQAIRDSSVKITDLQAELKEADSDTKRTKTLQTELRTLSQEQETQMYGFITAKDLETPPIQEALANVRSSVTKNFMRMLRTELSLSLDD